MIDMSNTVKVLIGLVLPFLGTSLGAAMIFLLKKELKPKLNKVLLGFASGVMLAASVWSLLIPSINMAESSGVLPWFPAVVGFLLGIGFLLTLDTIIPHLHLSSDTPEGKSSKLKRSTMLVLAVTLHNIPEGMAVGVVFASVLTSASEISAMAAIALAIGIAIQNFPEGAIISFPLITNGFTKRKAFAYGVLSGIVEPISAVITILMASIITPFLPYILAFAAGAMIYVVVEELIPECQSGDHSNIGTVATAIGFALMLFLDVALG